MTKGYWIAMVDVTDPEGYKAYVAANAEPFRKYGARFLARGGRKAVPEGAVRSRVVIIEFASYEAALACYHSPEYERARALRLDHAVANLVVVEGYDGWQPGD